MILILTGPTRHHKTTTLIAWASHRDDCGGVVSPDVDGLRVLQNVKTKEIIPWQKNIPGKNDLIVGRFAFDADGFNTAVHWLNEHLDNPEVRHIILDEIGSLELEGNGWGPWLRSALPVLGDKTLILVVRRPLLDEVINHYGMEEVSVVERSYFEK